MSRLGMFVEPLSRRLVYCLALLYLLIAEPLLSSIPVKAAATVVVLRDAPCGVETLLLKRQSNLAFAGGQWVFPGGSIDNADFTDTPDDLLAAARRAAAREAHEEAGLTLDPAAFDYIGHWTTPVDVRHARRFATWFFAVRYEGDAAIVVDGGEIAAHRWVDPAQALLAHRQRRVDMMPPTFATLSEIAHCQSAAEALAAYRARPVIEVLAKACPTEEGRCLLYPGDAGYDSGDPAVPGGRHRIVMTAEGWRYDRRL